MENFTVNGKVYNAKDLDFSFLVMMDKADIDIEHITGLSAINLYFAYCANITENQASAEINQQFIKEGNISELTDAYVFKINESDFFRSIMGTNNQETEKETSSTTKKDTKSKRTQATE